MGILTSEDISLDGSQNLLEDGHKPGIEDVIFDVSNHLEAILENIGQKFTINGKNGNTAIYSLIDVRNFRLQGKNKILELFSNGFNINLKTPKGIEEANRYFKKAKEIFLARYSKKLPYGVANKHIHSVKDIQDIFKRSGDTVSGVFFCALAKTFLIYVDYIKDIRVSGIGKIHHEITQKLLGGISNIEETSIGNLSGTINLGKNINVKIIHRAKSIGSIVGKGISDIDYNTVNDFTDLHGYTIELETKNPRVIILALQNYYLTLSGHDNKQEITIENKGLVSFDDIIPMKDELDPNFYEAFLDSLIKSHKKEKEKREKKGTAEGYKDIKMKMDIKTGDPRGDQYAPVYSGTEIKFTISGNSNEKGIAFHSIFDYNKRFRELTRLVGYIRHTDIINFINDFFNELGGNLNYKGIKRSQFLSELFKDLQKEGFIPDNLVYEIENEDIEKIIMKGLYRYYIFGLMKVKATKNSKKIFFVHPSYFKLVPDIQPELIIIDENEKS